MGRRVCGIDYGTSRIAIAAPSLSEFHEYVLKPGDNLGALDVLAEITWNTVTCTHAEAVAIESPIQGMSRNVRIGIQLGMVAGAVAVAARQAGAEVMFVEPSKWKKAVVGFGNASKADVSAFVEGHHPGLYAQCKSQDMVDAVCLALYAENVLAG
jgi:Holliday junction resolvasome RuvABC endonuclease subunit